VKNSAVLIVGAGPTGLALACDLRSRGIDVLIIDKATGPATTSRGLGLQARGREILDRLGALGDLPKRAVHAQATNVYVGKQRIIRFVVETQLGRINLGALLISQAEVEAALRKRLTELGGTVLWRHEAIAATQDNTGVDVTVRTSDGESSMAADWLIGCDGAHSQVRKMMDVKFEGRPFPESLILADVQMSWDRPATEGSVWLHSDGMFLVVPLPGGIWRISAELRPDDPMAKAGHGAMSATSESLPVSNAEVLDRLQIFLRDRVGDTETRISNPSWISIFRFHRRLASAYRNGRMLLAGDAAHIHSALGGQGMNAGLGDAFNLGWKLSLVAQNRASIRLLDSYQAERRPVAADVVKNTSRAWDIFLGRTPFDRLFRDLLFLTLMRLPAIQRRWIDSGSQLRVTYRRGPLARAASNLRPPPIFRRGPVVGDRGPDAVCRLLPAGTPTTLGEQARACWTFLFFGNSEISQRSSVQAARCCLGDDFQVFSIQPPNVNGTASEARTESDAALEDHLGELARAYHASKSTAILLRPDGHIGWRSSRGETRALAAWLRAALNGEDDSRTSERETPMF
jgi:4,5-epoxidase